MYLWWGGGGGEYNFAGITYFLLPISIYSIFRQPFFLSLGLPISFGFWVGLLSWLCLGPERLKPTPPLSRGAAIEIPPNLFDRKDAQGLSILSISSPLQKHHRSSPQTRLASPQNSLHPSVIQDHNAKRYEKPPVPSPKSQRRGSMLPPSLSSRRFPFRWPRVPCMFEQRTLASKAPRMFFRNPPPLPGGLLSIIACVFLFMLVTNRDLIFAIDARCVSYVMCYFDGGFILPTFSFDSDCALGFTMNVRCAFCLRLVSGDSESKPGNHRVRTKYEYLGYEIFRFGLFWKMDWGFEGPK